MTNTCNYNIKLANNLHRIMLLMITQVLKACHIFLVWSLTFHLLSSTLIRFKTRITKCRVVIFIHLLWNAIIHIFLIIKIIRIQTIGRPRIFSIRLRVVVLILINSIFNIFVISHFSQLGLFSKFKKLEKLGLKLLI